MYLYGLNTLMIIVYKKLIKNLLYVLTIGKIFVIIMYRTDRGAVKISSLRLPINGKAAHAHRRK